MDHQSQPPAPRAPRSRLRRILRAIGYGILSLVGLVLVLAAAGAIYEAVARARGERRYRAPGRLVDVGGHRLHLHCTGQGGPTVVLDTGLGVPARGWALVEPELARLGRVCSYDRAGYGHSDPGPGPRTSERVADELHALLARAGERAPYVLVGHSFGGMNARVYARRHPAEVAGLVLVDASHEDLHRRLDPSGHSEEAGRAEARQMIQLGLAAKRVGVLRLWPALMDWDPASPVMRRIRGEVFDELIHLFLQTKSFESAGAEMDAFARSGEQARAAGALGDLPLVVLTAGRKTPTEGLPPEVAAKVREHERLWVEELQVALARLSTRGRQVVVAESGHMIPFEQPEAIVAAVREVVEAARR